MEQSKTTSDDFKAGVKAAFDWIMIATANNYSGNAKSNEERQQMNDWLEDMAYDALHILSPDRAMEWKSLTETMRENEILKTQLARE